MQITRPTWRSILAIMTLVLTSSASAQEPVRSGPPPHIRALVDGLVKALNSGSDAWETFARERFAPALLARQTSAVRRAEYDALRTAMGTLTFDRAMRQGPDAPLELEMKGSTGAARTIAVEIDDSVPPRITGIDFGGAGRDAPADPLRPPVHGRMTSGELGRALDAFLSTLAAEDVFSGVVLVARQGEPVFQKAYGYADRANRRPNTLQTRFNVGSINKTFTQIAIAQLVAAGKLALADPLGKWLPDYPQAVSRTATIEQLLTHRAGVADFFGPAFTRAPKDAFRSNADYVAHVAAQPPRSAPGEREQYCNGCYILLGEIIARASGRTYEQYVAEHVFQPADMGRTGYLQTDAIEPDVAIGYTRRGADATLRSNVYLHGSSGSAAGGGYSTAGDLLAFVRARRDGRFGQQSGGLGIAGGAPGINAIVEGDRDWTVIVLSNLDPPTAERLGINIMEALQR